MKRTPVYPESGTPPAGPGTPLPTVALIYELVTEASADKGDWAESGWIALKSGEVFPDDFVGSRPTVLQEAVDRKGVELGSRLQNPFWGRDAQAWFTAREHVLVDTLAGYGAMGGVICDKATGTPISAVSADGGDSVNAVLAFLDHVSDYFGVAFVEGETEPGGYLIFRAPETFSDETADGIPADLSIHVHFEGLSTETWAALARVLK